MGHHSLLKSVAVVAMLAVMMAVVACATPASQGEPPLGQNETPASQDEPAPPGSAAELDNTRWVLTSFGDGTLPSQEAASPTLAFAAGQVTGNSSINGYSGSYTASDGNLEFGVLAGTLMAGPEPLNLQEQAFMQAFDQTARYEVREDTLRLLDSDGNLLLSFARVQ